MKQNILLGFVTLIALFLVITLNTTLTGKQVDEEILFPDFELIDEPQEPVVLEPQPLEETPPQEQQPEEPSVEETVPQEHYPEISRPEADQECLQTCDQGFSNCQHRAQGDDKKTRRCYSSKERCFKKCEERT